MAASHSAHDARETPSGDTKYRQLTLAAPQGSSGKEKKQKLKEIKGMHTRCTLYRLCLLCTPSSA